MVVELFEILEDELECPLSMRCNQKKDKKCIRELSKDDEICNYL
jgi:hypothetical protein